MKKSLVIVAAAFTVMAAIGQARAQAAPLFVYSVKYVCGLQTIPSTSFRPPAEPPVKPGNYATAINFHNYHLKGTVLRKKAVIAGVPGVSAGQISPITGLDIGPNQALTIDCNQIFKAFPVGSAPLPPFIEGFVEIMSPVQLSVAAVYTSQTCINPANRCSVLGEVTLDVVTQSAFRDQ